MQKKRINWGGLFRASITIALLVLLFTRISIHEVIKIIEKVSWINMIAVIFLTIFAAGLNTFKWQILLADQDLKVPYHRLFYLFLVGFFFNNLLLSGSGDLKRMYDLSKETGNSQKAVISVILERWSGGMGLLLWVCFSMAIALPVLPQLGWIFILSLFLLVSGFVFLPFMDRLFRLKVFNNFSTIKNFLDQMPMTAGLYRKKSLWLSLGISVIASFFMIVIHWILGKAVGLGLPFVDYVRLIPVIMAVSYLPVSINGLGVQESGFYLLFTLKNIKGTESLSISILSHLAKIFVGAIGGILYFAEGFRNGNKK